MTIAIIGVLVAAVLGLAHEVRALRSERDDARADAEHLASFIPDAFTVEQIDEGPR